MEENWVPIVSLDRFAASSEQSDIENVGFEPHIDYLRHCIGDQEGAQNR
jgi:hypothetical protein